MTRSLRADYVRRLMSTALLAELMRPNVYVRLWRATALIKEHRQVRHLLQCSEVAMGVSAGCAPCFLEQERWVFRSRLLGRPGRWVADVYCVDRVHRKLTPGQTGGGRASLQSILIKEETQPSKELVAELPAVQLPTHQRRRTTLRRMVSHTRRLRHRMREPTRARCSCRQTRVQVQLRREHGIVPPALHARRFHRMI